MASYMGLSPREQVNEVKQQNQHQKENPLLLYASNILHFSLTSISNAPPPRSSPSAAAKLPFATPYIISSKLSIIPFQFQPTQQNSSEIDVGVTFVVETELKTKSQVLF
ncbi:unnamed protein product [Lathyrus sativus]|nr:unnamed protein product [Lathyrus sativus]